MTSGPGSHPPGSSRPPARYEPLSPDIARSGGGSASNGGGPGADLGAAVPFGVRLAGAWSWRVIVTAVVGLGVVTVLGRLSELVIALAIAVLLAALLRPIERSLSKHRMPKILAVVIPFVGLIVAVAALVALVVVTVQSGIGSFEQHATATYRSMLDALSHSPLAISQSDVNGAVSSAGKVAKANSGKIALGAFTGADLLIHLVVGLLLTLFLTLFFLIDGPGIWRWCVRLAPRRGRSAVDGAGKAAWLSIHEYVRVQVLVALLDGVGVGVIAAILRVPFAVPLGVLVFLGAFIPIVGSITTGLLAVFVALAYNNPINALVMLVGVLAVNQTETHVLQPLLMGGAVRLHPVAIVLAVAGGTILGGVVGAVFAVPLLAASNSAVKYIAGGRWKEEPPPTGPVPTSGDPSPRRDHDPAPGDVTTAP